MASSSLAKVPYFRLRNELDGFEKEEEEYNVIFKYVRSWSKFRKINGRKRPRVRIPGLRKFLRKRGRKFLRKGGTFLSTFRVSLAKVLWRLKDGQAHMNDLLGGNYLFMQPNPSPFRCADQRPYLVTHGFHGLPPSRYSLGRIA